MTVWVAVTAGNTLVPVHPSALRNICKHVCIQREGGGGWSERVSERASEREGGRCHATVPPQAIAVATAGDGDGGGDSGGGSAESLHCPVLPAFPAGAGAGATMGARGPM